MSWSWSSLDTRPFFVGMRDELDVALECCGLRRSLSSLYSIEPFNEPFNREGTKKRSRTTKLGQRHCHTPGRLDLMVATESRVMMTQTQHRSGKMSAQSLNRSMVSGRVAPDGLHGEARAGNGNGARRSSPASYCGQAGRLDQAKWIAHTVGLFNALPIASFM